ncbi:MAG: hypothetical protein ACK421_10925 [Pseudanabaenaceae cyanobacterium]
MAHSSPPPVQRQDLERVLGQLAAALQTGLNQGIERGWFHLPSRDHDALWLAASILHRSGHFSQYKLTFYHQGKTPDTCGVLFELTAVTNEPCHD